MIKFIPLPGTNAGEMSLCNKGACENCNQKKEITQPIVASKADGDKSDIMQLYYAALLQSCISGICKGKQDNAYLHCT